MNKRNTIQDIKQDQEYSIPVIFFTDTKYKNMNTNTKVLYAILNYRQKYSLRNGWIDNEGYIYFIYKQKDLMELLKVSNKSMVKYMRELEEYNLIYRKKQGLNKPDLLYLLKLD